MLAAMVEAYRSDPKRFKQEAEKVRRAPPVPQEVAVQTKIIEYVGIKKEDARAEDTKEPLLDAVQQQEGQRDDPQVDVCDP
jgi:hypothetical protein